VQLPAHRPFIQRLDVLEPVVELITAHVDLVLRHRVKPEGVTGSGESPSVKTG
jgi:hypothetical protein